MIKALVVMAPVLFPNPISIVAGFRNPVRLAFAIARTIAYLPPPRGFMATSVGKELTRPENTSEPSASLRNRLRAKSTGTTTGPAVSAKWNASVDGLMLTPEANCTVNSAARRSLLGSRTDVTSTPTFRIVRPVWRSCTFTVNVVRAVLPDASVAVNVIVVVPAEKLTGPLSVATGCGSTRSLRTGEGNPNAVRATGTAFTVTVTWEGVIAIVGGVVSRTMMRKLPLAMLPAASLAEQPTVDVPSGKT